MSAAFNELPEAARLFVAPVVTSMNPSRRFLTSTAISVNGKQQANYQEVEHTGVVLPSSEKALKSILSRPPIESVQAWAKTSAPRSLGFTFAAPISSEEALEAEPATSVSVRGVAGDAKGYWSLCPTFVLDTAKPSSGAESAKSGRRTRESSGDDIHPFLACGGKSGGLASFDSEGVAKHDRVLVLGTLLDIRAIDGGYLHLYVVDDHPPEYLAACGIPVLSSSLQPNKTPVTSGAVTRQLGR